MGGSAQRHRGADRGPLAALAVAARTAQAAPFPARPGASLPILAAALLLILMLAGCTPLYRVHGFAPAEEDLALIEVGVDTRDSVEAVVGRPSSQGMLTTSAWYYVQSQFETRGAAAPKELNRQVVAISFDEDGTVANIERFGLEKGNVVALSRRVTESNVRGIGLVRQLLGNLGNIRADQVVQ